MANSLSLEQGVVHRHVAGTAFQRLFSTALVGRGDLGYEPRQDIDLLKAALLDSIEEQLYIPTREMTTNAMNHRCFYLEMTVNNSLLQAPTVGHLR